MEQGEEKNWKSWIRIPTRHPNIAIEAAKLVYGENFVDAEVIYSDLRKYPGTLPDVIVHTNTPAPTLEEDQQKATDLLLQTMDSLEEKKKKIK